MSSPILDPAPYQTISTVRAELNLWFPHYPCARGGVEVGEDMGTDDDIPKYAEMCAAFPFCRRQTEGPAHLNGGGGMNALQTRCGVHDACAKWLQVNLAGAPT